MAKHICYPSGMIIPKLCEAVSISARIKRWQRPAKPWKSANNPATAGVGNTGEWKS
jgi:hypothetical protein